MPINYNEIIWVDVNSNFGEDIDPELVIDVASINNSLFNLFNCPIGSRPFEREYGSDLMKALFEPTDQQTVDFLDITLFQSIKRWEPRIKIDLARSQIKQTSDGAGYTISVAYTILRTSKTGSYEFSVSTL